MLAYDGITDDRAALQSLIDACPPGGVVSLEPNKIVRILVEDLNTPDRGLILKPNVTLDLNRSTLNIECSGQVYGVRFQNGSVLRRGKVAIVGSHNLGSAQSIYHTPIALGDGYSEILNVNARGPYLEARNWGIHDIDLSTVKPNGCMIAGIGGIRDGHISDVRAADNSNAIGMINFDWGTAGPAGNIPTNRVNYNAGTFRTVHPYNIKIERVVAGRFTNPNGHIIRLSGCSKIDVSDVSIDWCSGPSAIFHTGGDYGYEFAQHSTIQHNHPYLNTAFRNVTILWANQTGIEIECLADNISREPNYTPRMPTVYKTNILVAGLACDGGGVGLKMRHMIGGIVTRAKLRYFTKGAEFGPNLSRFVWADSDVTGQNVSSVLSTGAGAELSRVYYGT